MAIPFVWLEFLAEKYLPGGYLLARSGLFITFGLLVGLPAMALTARLGRAVWRHVAVRSRARCGPGVQSLAQKVAGSDGAKLLLVQNRVLVFPASYRLLTRYVIEWPWIELPPCSEGLEAARFALMHELGHIRLGHHKRVYVAGVFSWLNPYGGNYLTITLDTLRYEHEADIYAARMLSSDGRAGDDMAKHLECMYRQAEVRLAFGRPRQRTYMSELAATVMGRDMLGYAHPSLVERKARIVAALR
jgi:hypothetical protein